MLTLDDWTRAVHLVHRDGGARADHVSMHESLCQRTSREHHGEGWGRSLLAVRARDPNREAARQWFVPFIRRSGRSPIQDRSDPWYIHGYGVHSRFSLQFANRPSPLLGVRVGHHQVRGSVGEGRGS
jgi:hypothetical protein